MLIQQDIQSDELKKIAETYHAVAKWSKIGLGVVVRRLAGDTVFPETEIDGLLAQHMFAWYEDETVRRTNSKILVCMFAVSTSEAKTTRAEKGLFRYHLVKERKLENAISHASDEQ